MKKYQKSILSSLMLGILLLLSFTSCLENDNIVNSSVYNDDIEYYHYDQHGKEIYFTKCKHRIAIYVNPEEKVNEVLEELKSKNLIFSGDAYNPIYAIIDSTRTDIVEKIKVIKNVESVHYTVKIDEEDKDGFQVTKNYVSVRPKSNISIHEILEKGRISTNLIDRIEPAKFSDAIYLIYFITTDLDFYKLSRDLYKTGLCEYATPGFRLFLIPYNS
ncbi:MAG: hypothetical protein GX372_03305 [Ignavibacteria bacterium]|jgi:hypothetical protein|nr:hypothetical protein [Ignavibacteria bacterium]